MARRTMFATLVVMAVAAAALIEGTAAAVHIVGDATGWTIPAGGAAFYSTWAANKTFAVGDILVFNFASGAHDVAKVTKTSYDSCSSANPISLQATAPVNITLTTSGDHYFICTIAQHCASGQKLSVNIPTAAGSPTPTPSPSPAPPTASPTPTPTPPPTPSPTPTPSTAPTPPPAAHSPTPSPAPPTSPPTESPPPPPGSPASEPPSPGESTSPPPPPPSSAPHKAAAAFGVAVMSIAVAALF